MKMKPNKSFNKSKKEYLRRIKIYALFNQIKDIEKKLYITIIYKYII